MRACRSYACQAPSEELDGRDVEQCGGHLGAGLGVVDNEFPAAQAFAVDQGGVRSDCDDDLGIFQTAKGRKFTGA